VSDTHEITLDELVRRVNQAAARRKKNTPDRLLLLNAAAALESLGLTLQQTMEELALLRAKRATETPGAPRVILGGGLHRVN
jgi:hypothetical protein